MDIEKTTDLLDFINYEKLDKSALNYKLIYNYFYKCCFKTIIELSDKFSDNNEKLLCVTMGSKMFFYVFFVLIIYTNNLKLTIFLSERAILLYSEFIIMSRDTKISDDLNYIPNISDAISFAYKKTIGPIKIEQLDNNYKINIIRDTCNIIVNIYNTIYLKNYKLFENSDLISIVDDKIINSIYILFQKIDTEKRNYLHIKIINIIETSKNLESSLILVKIIIDSLLKQLQIDQKEFKYIKKIFISVYDDFLEKDTDLKLTDLTNLKETNIFNDIRKSVKLFKKLYK